MSQARRPLLLLLTLFAAGFFGAAAYFAFFAAEPGDILLVVEPKLEFSDLPVGEVRAVDFEVRNPSAEPWRVVGSTQGC